MTSFILKIIGILTMLCDHIGDSVVGKFSFLNFIGRFAFPIFAFQVVNGFIHTKDFKKYILRMLIFAAISQIPFMLFLSTFTKDFNLNVFFTFTLGLCALFIYKKIDNKLIGFIIVAAICAIAELIKVDYGAFGIITIFIFYLFKDKKMLTALYFIPLCFIKYIPNILELPILYQHYLKLGLFTALSIIPILLYNGKQGPKLKYLFYIFYPLHLIILWAIHTFLLK